MCCLEGFHSRTAAIKEQLALSLFKQAVQDPLGLSQ